jgi:HK97 family phage major capsid protein
MDRGNGLQGLMALTFHRFPGPPSQSTKSEAGINPLALGKNLIMAMLDSNSLPILKVWDQQNLVITPWKASSFAQRASTLVGTESPTVRFPVVPFTGDVVPAFTPENTLISESDVGLDQLLITPQKLAVLTRISREQAMDTNPEVQGVVGDSIVRALARATDAAFIGPVSTGGDHAVLGLYAMVESYNSATGEPIQIVDAGSDGTFTNFDPFIEGLSLVEQYGGNVTCWLADARTVEQLSLVKTFTGDVTSNQPLLTNGVNGTFGVSDAQPRQLFGRPLFSLPASAGIQVGDVFGVDQSAAFYVIREGVTLATSSEVYFDSDAIAIRATTRISPAFPSPQHHVLVSTNSGGS